MKIVTQISELKSLLSGIRHAGESIGFVPTMGNLHKGHMKLIDAAAAKCDRVVVSIFVNPMQFGEKADLEAYPDTPDEDEQLLSAHNVAILYRPTVVDVFPSGLDAQTRIIVPGISEILEGEERPGHFTGVATVVSWFLNLINPDMVFFGKKDYQQFLLIKKMVTDLAMNIQVVGSETVRHENGLAMSSRNTHLTVEQFDKAAELYQMLNNIAAAYCEDKSKGILQLDMGLMQLIKAGLSIDYLTVRRQHDLREPQDDDVNLVVLVAARLGNTRLLDNLEFELK